MLKEREELILLDEQDSETHDGKDKSPGDDGCVQCDKPQATA